MNIVLASASPRRRQLLGELVRDFQICVSSVEESSRQTCPGPLALELAKRKAAAVFALYPDCLVIGADTVVALKDELFGKPESNKQAFDMLKKLSGSSHDVFTGVCILSRGKEEVFCVHSVVHFHPLTEQQILKYIATGSPMDKAGAYGIQDSGFVRSVEGSYSSVMGLPQERLRQTLKEKFFVETIK